MLQALCFLWDYKYQICLLIVFALISHQIVTRKFIIMYFSSNSNILVSNSVSLTKLVTTDIVFLTAVATKPYPSGIFYQNHQFFFSKDCLSLLNLFIWIKGVTSTSFYVINLLSFSLCWLYLVLTNLSYKHHLNSSILQHLNHLLLFLNDSN